MMTTGEMGIVKLNGEEMEVVDSFQFLGVLVTSDASCAKEIKTDCNGKIVEIVERPRNVD